jgi:hypothetical protein
MQVLNRTKIVVHIQRYPGKVAAMRFLMAMANGAMIVAEPCYRPEPFVPGVHYAEAPVEKMPALIRHYLADSEERERIVRSARDLITSDLSFHRTLGEMVSVMTAELSSQERSRSAIMR